MKKQIVYLVLFFSLASSYSAHAQETRFKAIMLYQFTKLIGWPSLQNQKTNFVIGIYGDPKVYKLTNYYTKGKKVGARPIKVEYYSTVKEIKKCEILYISYAKTKYLPVVIQRVGKKTPTFIVTTRQGALKYGSTANFVIQNQLMKVELNGTDALNRKLQISYQLRKAAVRVIQP